MGSSWQPGRAGVLARSLLGRLLGLHGSHLRLASLYLRNLTIFMLFVFSVITSLLFSLSIYGSSL